MIDVSHWALNNKKLVYFLIAVLLIGGVLSYRNMSKLEDPEITVKLAMVVTTYPGASAHQVEMEVTDLLEKSIRSMNNLNYVESRSLNDVSMITVGLALTVPDEEVQQYWDMLRRKVNDVQASLPSEARASQVIDNFGDVYGMFYAVTSDGFSDQEVGDYTEMVKREIQAIKGVSRVAIYGQRNDCINIQLLQEQMANLGVHPVEVLMTLKTQNQTVYPGYYESGGERIRIAVNDRYKSIDDIRSLLIEGHEEDMLRLEDIALVTRSYEEPVRNELRYDRQQALGLSIAALSGTDITKLGKEVQKKLDELQQTRIPAGIEFHKVFYQPERVEVALNEFMVNLIESVAIVVFVLIFTMGFKSGLILGFSLLIVVLGTFVILNVFDGTLQRVSLGAFILAMGMLVDNGIVILDGILVDFKRGKSRTEALTAIGRKTAMPLLGATLIAILAFFPIYLSPDTAGVYVRDLFIVLGVSLLLSWLLALTQVPIQVDLMLKPTVNKEGEPLFNNRYYAFLRRILSFLLTHKTVTVCVALLLVAVSGFCFRFVPQEFFPDMKYDQLYIEYKLPEGATGNQVKADLETIEEYLLSRNEITHVTTSIGATPSRYNLVRSIADPSLSYGELIVDYISPNAVAETAEEIQIYLTENYPQAYVRLKRYNLMYKKYPIEVQFRGPDPTVLKQLTAEAEDIMKSNSRIMLVRNDWEPETPVLMVDYNQPLARGMGLDRSDVGISVLLATDGIPAGVFFEGQHPQNIYLKATDPDGSAVKALHTTPVFSLSPISPQLNKQTLQGLMTGSLSEEELLEETLRPVPLNQATNGIKIRWEDPVVVRYDGQRAMKAQCNPAYGYTAEQARQAIAEEIEAISLPTGYTMQWEGERKSSGESSRYLFDNFPLSVILMISILIMLFKDYKKPLIIFCSAPLLLVGVVLGLLISGKALGFVAIVGILGLMGMMVKNGIVLMDEINRLILEGVEPVKALLESASGRFRPVMMASLTTILGMIPLVNDSGFGSLAVTIMGGLLIGTLITLLFIPVLYALFFGIKVTPEKLKQAQEKQS